MFLYSYMIIRHALRLAELMTNANRADVEGGGRGIADLSKILI